MIAVRCQQGSGRPCFDSDLLSLESDLLIFRFRPFHLSNQSFPLFPVSPSHFSTQTFPYFWVRPSHFSKSVLLIFLVRPSQFFGLVLLIFRVRPCLFFGVRPSHLSKSVLPIFFSVSFRILPILCSDLITMCTVDKIKDVGVCRKLLHCTTNSLARETK